MMTFEILTQDTHCIIYCSNVQSAAEAKCHNLCLDPLDAASPPINKSWHDSSPHGEAELTSSLEMPTFDAEDLIGHTFLMDPEEDGQHFHACIIPAIEDYETAFGKHEDHVKFICSVNNGEHEEFLSYNQQVNGLLTKLK